MTHSLGKGTVNLTVNVTDAEAAILGKIACKSDRSRGRLVKVLLLSGLRHHNATAAHDIHRARVTHRRQVRAAVLLVLVWLSLMNGADMVRAFRVRSSRRGNVEVVQ